MAQLKDDCLAFGGRFLSLEEAESRIAEQYGCVVGDGLKDLSQCVGRVLAHPFLADIPIPPYDNAAVDGYAVRFDDLSVGTPSILPLIGREAAGHASGAAHIPGTAVRIFTGAMNPSGADTVVMQEDCEIDGDHVRIPPGVSRGANLRRAGEDITPGTEALPGGRRLTPPDLALLGAQGQATVRVREPLRVALFSTGDEVTPPGQPLAPGTLYDANRFMLAGLLSRLGVDVTDGGILPDDAPHITGMLNDAARTHDLVMTSGGVSTGEEDHVRAAIEANGTLRFWRLAIRPGRPVALGDIAGTPLLGLPGNPVAALVTFAIIGRRLLDTLAGAAPVSPRRFKAMADFDLRKKAGRREFLRGTLHERDGLLYVRQYPKLGAGMISSLTESDVLLDLPAELTRIAPGDVLSVLPLSTLYG